MQASVDARDIAEARKAYKDLVAAYNAINASTLDDHHKEISHQQVVQAYNIVNSLKATTSHTRLFVMVAVIAIIASVLIVIKPEIIGLTLFEHPPDENHAPEWISEKQEFRITREKTYDLTEYFKDPDGDPMTFLSTSYPDLSVTITQNKITFTPHAPGSYKLGLVASDGDATAKVRVTVVAE